MFSSAPTNNKSSKISINFNAKNWVQVDSDQSDFAYKNIKSNSFLIINSNCKKYIANSLKGLTATMLSNITDLTIEKQTTHILKKREALSTYASGKVDGIKTHLVIITIKKNRCIYDFILISASKDSMAMDNSALMELINNSSIQ